MLSLSVIVSVFLSISNAKVDFDLPFIEISFSPSDVLMVTNDENYSIIDIFNNAHQAEVETGIKSIWPCVKKKKGYKTAGGFRWMYRKDYNELKKQLENELS